MAKNTLYSSHIFMFPFRFDWNEEGFENEFGFYQDKTISERLRFEPKGFAGWKLQPFDLKEHPEFYNEYAYFYDYARDAIYNIKGDPSPISYYYEREIDLTNAIYMIHIKQHEKYYTYTLNLIGLSLRIFDSGVAILSLELENRNKKDFDDILRINDFGRRIYPQYISNCSTDETKNSFLADYITLKTSTINVTENFNFEQTDDIVIGEHIMKLLGESFSQNKQDTQKFYIQPILDDRMFVLSWYGNDVQSFRIVYEPYFTSDDWYKYIFIDNQDMTVKNRTMKKKLLKKATYDRWSEGETLFGISRYSFVCLTNRQWFPVNIIRPHMHTMYFQMLTLLLATRASILRFSDEIAAIASQNKIDRLEILYEKYLTFYNRLYFKEVTHQDQGIELYDMVRKQMRIDEHIKKLDGKFTKLFDYSSLKQSNKESDAMNSLNLIVSALGVTGLFISIYSMGAFDFENSLKPFWWAVGSSVLAGGIALFGMYRYLKHAKE